MARKLRLEYDGAIYHVINRGNYRADVFGTDGAKTAFLRCLDEACAKSGWVVHAWCMMSNHYHLALETPQPNLVEGMRWMQATFAVRFNRLRDERGHIFQGRYKSLVVDADAALGPLCHYIHLNPVRAGIVTAEQLAQWPWCSASWLAHPKQRRAWFSPTATLDHAGGLPDTPAGRRRYGEYLAWLGTDDSAQKRQQFEAMSRGWVVGSREFKLALRQEHKQLQQAIKRGYREMSDLREAAREERLNTLLARAKKTAVDIERDPKGAPWKVAIASTMKLETTASNPWLAHRLNMGSPWRLCRLTNALRVRK